jgi:two-component system, response regulator YesN
VKILYIEDDDAFSSLAKVIFMKTKHDFVVCPNIEDAKQILDEEKIDLVILDMNFPHLSGVDILEHLWENHIVVPVIVYSGYIDEYAHQINRFVNYGVIKRIYSKAIEQHFDDIIKDVDALVS